MKRTCKKCNKSKPLDEFEEGRSCKYGHTYRCKECGINYRKQYRKINKKNLLIKNEIYYHKNKEIITVKAREYRTNNRIEIRDRLQKYYLENPRKHEKRKLQIKGYRDELKDYYIRGQIIRQYGINSKHVTSKMIEIKRELLIFHRLTKELKNGINSARD